MSGQFVQGPDSSLSSNEAPDEGDTGPKRAHVPGRHFNLRKIEAILDSPMYLEDWLETDTWSPYVRDNGLVLNHG